MTWLKNAAEGSTPLPRLSAACGLEDDLLPLNRLFVQAAAQVGVPLDYQEETGKHDWIFWQRQSAPVQCAGARFTPFPKPPCSWQTRVRLPKRRSLFVFRLKDCASFPGGGSAAFQSAKAGNTAGETGLAERAHLSLPAQYGASIRGGCSHEGFYPNRCALSAGTPAADGSGFPGAGSPQDGGRIRLDRARALWRFRLREELPRVYRSADVYVSASHVDGSSVSLLEALACGKPALVSDIPSNCEWVSPGEQGWLFQDGNANELADRMMEICEHGIDPQQFKKLTSLLRSPKRLSTPKS